MYAYFPHIYIYTQTYIYIYTYTPQIYIYIYTICIINPYVLGMAWLFSKPPVQIYGINAKNIWATGFGKIGGDFGGMAMKHANIMGI